MSRSGYSEDIDQWELIKWRGRVASAARGKRGQSFFLDLVNALDAMPEKRLIENSLQCAEGMCALGAVGAYRGINLEKYNPTDDHDDSIIKTERVAIELNVAWPLAAETVYINDEYAAWTKETPEQRWARIREWAVRQIGYAFEDDPKS